MGVPTRLFVLLTAVLVTMSAAVAAAQPVPRAAPSSVPLRVPLLVDNLPRDQIDVLVFLATNEVHVEADVLLAEVGPAITTDRRTTLAARRDPQGNLTLDDLRAVGLQADFDQADLELRVRIPSEIRATVELRLRPDTPPVALGGAVAPARVSGFLNYRTALEMVEQDGSGGLEPLNLNLDGALNVNGWALEGRGALSEADTAGFRRTETRLVRDFPDRALRLQIGDLTYRTRGMQSFLPLGGIGISKESSLQPYRLARPSGEAGFFLKEPATVLFVVNDRPLRSMRLSPGPYNARSFPFIGGINDVRIEITGDSGAREIIEFPFVFDGGLLNPGETEFGYAIGFPTTVQDGELRYDTSRLGGSLFHRYGVTNSLMLEGNFQADADVAVVGAGALVVGSVGTLRTDAAVSTANRTDGRDAHGYSIRSQFERRDGRPSNTLGRVVSGSVGYTSPTFASVGGPDALSEIEWDVGLRYSQRLFGLGVGFGVEYQFGRDDRRDTAGATVQLQRSFSQSTTATMRVRDGIDVAGVREQSVFFTVSFRPPMEGHTVSISRDTAAAATRVDWRFMPDDDTAGIGGFAAAERSSRSEAYSADFQYGGTRGTVGMNLAKTEPRDATVERQHSGSLRFAGGVAFADGAWAIGRPVAESFAILKPHPSLAGHAIGVNPTGDGTYQAEMDAFGPALLPSLVPYRAARATVDARQLPIGTNVGAGAFDLAPTYKRGTLITVGTGATVFLLSMVQTAAGEPVALQAGRVVSLDDPEFVPALVFTNRIGRLAVEGLRPGRYRLELFSAAERTIEFRIPDDAVGQFEIDILLLPEQPRVAGIAP